MSKKLGFALGAGGSRGVAHIGFLKAMEENGIVPDCIAGTSMGSVVGACYATGMSPDKMIEEINKLKFSHIFDLSMNPVKNGALLRAKKMRRQLAKYLKHYNYEQLKIPFCAVSTDLITGQPYVSCGKDHVIEGVVASSSIPGVFKPVEYHGKVLVDGGITRRVPIDEVRELGAEVVVAVDVLGKIRETHKTYNMLAVCMRIVDIMDDQLVDLRRAKQKPDLFLSPDLGDMSQYKFKDLMMAYEKGYELGLANVKKIKKLISKD